MRNYLLTLPLALVAVAACGDATTPLGDEVVLAQQAQLIADDQVQRTHADYRGWLDRFLAALRDSDDPEAQAFLAQAREYRLLARAAFEAGRLEQAREYHELAFRALLSAVIEVFPDAPATTGAVVDRIVERVEGFLGDRAAPRIRRILAHVSELREQAVAALTGGDPVTALALNVRALHILHRLVHHIRWRITDHDREAETDLHAIAY